MSEESYERDEFFERDESYYAPPPRPRPRPRRRRQRASTAAMTVRFAALSVVAAAVIGGGLAVQMAAGSDPALAPKQKAAVSSDTETDAVPVEPSTGSTAVAPTQVAPTQVAPAQVAPAPVISSTS